MKLKIWSRETSIFLTLSYVEGMKLRQHETIHFGTIKEVNVSSG